MARDRNRGAQGQDKLPRTTARTQRLASQRMNLCSYLVYAIAFSHAVPDHLEGALHGERGAECCDTPGVDVVLLFFICTLPLLSLYLVYRVSSEGCGRRWRVRVYRAKRCTRCNVRNIYAPVSSCVLTCRLHILTAQDMQGPGSFCLVLISALQCN